MPPPEIQPTIDPVEYDDEEIKTPHSVMLVTSLAVPEGRKTPVPIDYLSNIKCKGLIYQLVREPGQFQIIQQKLWNLRLCL